MIWNKGDNCISFFSFSYILNPRQIRISIISKHDVPTSRPKGGIGSQEFIQKYFLYHENIQGFTNFSYRQNNSCNKQLYPNTMVIFPKHFEFILHVNCSKNLSTLLDNRFFLKGQRQRNNKQVISSMRLFSSRFVLCEIFLLQRQRQQKKNQPRFSATDVSHLRRECKIHVGVS